MSVIDLRSDTVTRPCPAMYDAMCRAPLGDDVFNEDPTVHELENLAADLCGKEAALFLPTATQSNLVSILGHCQRGDEYLVGKNAHCYRWEAGGAAVLGSVQPQPLSMSKQGIVDLEEADASIKPDDPHFTISRLLCLENTHGGHVLPLDYIAQARVLCDRRGLKLHMDGARAFNAAVELGVPIRSIAQYVDSITLCLSKGLGCPTGAVLLGAREHIGRARRLRKMCGGGMRQAGVLAAAGVHALTHNIDRLAEDHENARVLAEAFGVDGLSVQTNMVFLDLAMDIQRQLAETVAQQGVRILYGYVPCLRIVLHKDITRDEAQQAGEILSQALRSIQTQA